MTGIVAVHCGAGKHGSRLFKEYKKLCKRASRKGVQVLLEGGSALDAVKAAITVLENDPLTNAGFGSNLTVEGTVECDAAIMDGSTLTYGSCGAIRKVKNPIMLAHDICVKQKEPLPLGLEPPMFLVGSGGLKHARRSGLKIVNSKQLVSKSALEKLKKCKNKLNQLKGTLLDTVGAVCMDRNGNVASGCSSGGILLKRPGRIGQSAVYGCGVWADSFEKSNQEDCSVALCTTGCGEQLVKTHLAREMAEDLRSSLNPVEDLHKSIQEKFLSSRFLRNEDMKLGGTLVLHHNNEKRECSLMWAHTTETMSVGYMKTNDEKPKSSISVLPLNAKIGHSVTVGGIYFPVP